MSHSIKDDPEILCARIVVEDGVPVVCGSVMKRVIGKGGGVIFPLSTRIYIK